MCGSAFWTSAGTLCCKRITGSLGSTPLILTLIMLVKKNCTAVHCSFLKILGDGFQNNVFTACGCPWWDLLIHNFKGRIGSVFLLFPTDCVLTLSTVGSRTRMLLFCGHARTWSETILLQFLASAQDGFQKQNSTSLH